MLLICSFKLTDAIRLVALLAAFLKKESVLDDRSSSVISNLSSLQNKSLNLENIRQLRKVGSCEKWWIDYATATFCFYKTQFNKGGLR